MAEQAFIQVRIDSKLKRDATAVLDEIGMDMPNAIRMFLKRVVLEQGLPFDTRLPMEPVSKREGAAKMPIQTIPAKPAACVPADQVIALICQVPEGFITRWEDIDEYFERLYKAQRIEVEPLANWSVYKNGMEVPYWRIVGTHGFIPDDRRAKGREEQIKRLEAEGLTIEPCGPGGRSRRVANHRRFKFNFAMVDENKIKCNDYGNTKHSAVADMLRDPEMYRVFTDNQLKQFASYDDGDDHDDELKQCAEYAKAELKRRCIKLTGDK